MRSFNSVDFNEVGSDTPSLITKETVSLFPLVFTVILVIGLGGFYYYKKGGFGLDKMNNKSNDDTK